MHADLRDEIREIVGKDTLARAECTQLLRTLLCGDVVLDAMEQTRNLPPRFLCKEELEIRRLRRAARRTDEPCARDEVVADVRKALRRPLRSRRQIIVALT